MVIETILLVSMFIVFAGLLLAGFHVAYTLFGVSVLYTAIAIFSDTFLGTATGLDFDFLGLTIKRIYSLMTNWILIAGTMFIFMGYMLEKSGIAERLLATTQELFGKVRGGMAITVVVIKALSAPTPAASVTVAIPAMINPSTSTISSRIGAASSSTRRTIPQPRGR